MSLYLYEVLPASERLDLIAQLRINSNRTKAARMLIQNHYLPQPLSAITKALTYLPDQYRITHPSWQPQRIGYQPFPFPTFTKALVSSMHSTIVDGDTGFLARMDPDTARRELVDDSFVRESLRRLGGPGAFGLNADLTRTEEVDPQ